MVTLNTTLYTLAFYFMATRRRTSAVKSTTAKKSPRTVVKKSTVTPIKSVNKVTPIEEVKVTETPVKNVEKKVTRSLTQLDGFELILLPLLYLEDFAKRLINNQF
tara:strand:- start:98 stop:412 length:315 start_codon:yes stop_codon:yes gene_type:complete